MNRLKNDLRLACGITLAIAAFGFFASVGLFVLGLVVILAVAAKGANLDFAAKTPKYAVRSA